MTTIKETNLTKLVEANREGIEYEEHYACGWVRANAQPSKRIVTIAEKYPTAEIVVFGDTTIGIEIEGQLWAAEMPNDLRGGGKQHRLPHEDWQWLNWASGHTYESGDGPRNMGDSSDLRKVTDAEAKIRIQNQ